MATLGLNQLRVFEAVTRCGSFIKAADRLHVTPPAVSLQIRGRQSVHIGNPG